MTETPDAVITELPEQKSTLWTRNKGRLAKVGTITVLVGASAYALGRKSKSGSCPNSSSDNAETDGQPETTD